jgi:hypothetical protein
VARGWESKSVEEQQAEARAASTPAGSRMTSKEVAAKHQRDGLLLSRKRIERQLEDVQNPTHRKMLEQALAALDASLARLG